MARDEGTELLKRAYEHYRDKRDDTTALALCALLLLRKHRLVPSLRGAAVRVIRSASYAQCAGLGLRLPPSVNGLRHWAQRELEAVITQRRAAARGVPWEASEAPARKIVEAARVLGLVDGAADVGAYQLARLRRELIVGTATSRALALLVLTVNMTQPSGKRC